MFICEKNYSCCNFEYWDKLEDAEQEARECGHLIEVAPVVHSKWVKDRDGDEYCENCSRYMPVREVTGDPSATDYCPNCGCRMDGGNEYEKVC